MITCRHQTVTEKKAFTAFILLYLLYFCQYLCVLRTITRFPVAQRFCNGHHLIRWCIIGHFIQGSSMVKFVKWTKCAFQKVRDCNHNFPKRSHFENTSEYCSCLHGVLIWGYVCPNETHKIIQTEHSADMLSTYWWFIVVFLQSAWLRSNAGMV